jgi:transcriptional regulator with XRE-family HTH domain
MDVDARGIGRILKAHRTLAGLSQMETAARAGIAAATLSLAESGRRPLAATTTVRILALLAAARDEGAQGRAA